ncbi:MAG: hypothetical protein LBS16_07730 [Prevotellaceae bacterium]|nr:hypothetical protein [Prevotellaceae bacterium]
MTKWGQKGQRQALKGRNPLSCPELKIGEANCLKDNIFITAGQRPAENDALLSSACKAGLFITCRTFQVQVRTATFSANCAIACMRL